MKVVFRLLKNSTIKGGDVCFTGIFLDAEFLRNFNINTEDPLLLHTLDHYSQPFTKEYVELIMETPLDILTLIEKVAENTKGELEFTKEKLFENDSRIKQVIVKTSKEQTAASIRRIILATQDKVGFELCSFSEKTTVN